MDDVYKDILSIDEPYKVLDDLVIYKQLIEEIRTKSY